jgi:hypothetical protein
MKRSLRLLVTALAATILLTSQPVSACGPFFEQAVLVQSAHPDIPLAEFAKGNLGILRPKFARSYLAVAYRYLQDKPLTAAEQKAAADFWNYRLGYEWTSESSAVNAWKAARKAYLTAAGCEIDQWRSFDAADGSWQNYLNCPDDAFITATATLKDRAAKLGSNSKAVTDWIKAQDEVFCHCGGPAYDFKTQKRKDEPPFPQPVAADADPLVKADRAYQIAAANFYGQKFDDAIKGFQAIAADSASPWSVWAPYLVARTLTRQATIPDKPNTAILGQAETQVQAVLANPALSMTHEPARKLQNFIGIRLHPDKTLSDLSAALNKPGEGAALKDNLIDYTVTFDNVLGRQYDDIDPLTYATVPNAIKQDDMSDWIATFQSNDEPARAHALEKYAATKSNAWLVAALTKADPKAPITESLIDSAFGVQPNSAAYLTANYRAAQLIGAKSPSVATKALDKALAVSNLPPSTRNLLQDERSKYADSLREFVTLSVRTPAVLSSDYEGNELPDDPEVMKKMTSFYSGQKVFSPIGAEFFNLKATMPQFVETVGMNVLPPQVQKNFVQAAWSRAYLLDDKVNMSKMAPLLRAAYPAMAPLLAPTTRTAPDELRFVGALLMLRNPGMRPIVNWGLQRATDINRIDDYQDNWWPMDSKEWPSLTTTYNLEADQKTATFPAVIVKPNPGDVAKIHALGAAPSYLSREVITYAKAHPADARVPEALALAVKATRFGPKDGKTSAYSKEAFQILHKKYPTSPWTKRTPYYY